MKLLTNKTSACMYFNYNTVTYKVTQAFDQ